MATDPILHIVWSEADIVAMLHDQAEDNDAEVTPEQEALAITAAREWSRHVADTANQLIGEQFFGIVTAGQP